tara:strand:+ start:582 stop:1202 length:621 start_codon:yes stop_codon:yes gene_type:complete
MNEIKNRSIDFYKYMKKRRTVRDFSEEKVPIEVIENCIRTADTAPSGANQHPWHFVIISDPEIKNKIRNAAEKEEKKFYNGRAPKEWLEAIAHLGTNEKKPFLENAPYLIAIFSKTLSYNDKGKKIKNYYVSESVGIATGILISAIHKSGLASLTHTPSPMGFLNKILNRPKNERPFLILVVGLPKKDAKVPDIKRKMLKEIISYY